MKVKIITIDKEYELQRIDNFLLSYYKDVPKSHIYKIIRKGEVRVNKKRVKPLYKLQEGDKVRIPPVKQLNTKQENLAHKLPSKFKDSLLNNILYEDNYMLVINKPSGLAVHGGSGINGGLIELLRLIRPNDKYLELVHRLDRDTSGCIIIAKKRSMLRELHSLLRENKIKKYYHALVLGQPKDKFTQKVPLRRNVLKSGERIVEVDIDSGLQSCTKFKVLKRFDKCCLVEACPVTGRTHQIRVHAAYSHNPIAFDEKYGNREFNDYVKKNGLKRLFLHAKKLKFKCPKTDQMRIIEADYDSNLLSFLEFLKICKTK